MAALVLRGRFGKVATEVCSRRGHTWQIRFRKRQRSRVASCSHQGYKSIAIGQWSRHNSQEPSLVFQERQLMPQPKKKSRSATQSKDALLDYVLDDQPGFLLRVAWRTHTSIFTSKMIESLTPPQFSTLAKLREVGPCSQNHLGRLIHFDSATITGVINRLRTRGLIESYTDPLDSRRLAIDLTDEGRRIADRAIATIKEISGETFAPLSTAERRTLAELLKKIIAR